MGELVSQKTLAAIIARDKAAQDEALCASCGWYSDDPLHGDVGDDLPATDCLCDGCYPPEVQHAFKPKLSRTQKDRRLLLRTLNNIVEEWGTYEAAARLDRMIVDILVAAGKKKGD